jgi:outer membrane protein
MHSKINKIILAFVILGLIINGVVIYIVMQKQDKRVAFVVNQKLFNEFAGKKELEKKLSDLRTRNNITVDSLWQLTRQTPIIELRQSYQVQIERIKMMEEDLANQYTADIWKRINEWVSEYGKANQYDFVLGAVGNGSLMYAEEANDITESVIVYVNKRYAGE